jgi:hypothetical protein
LGDAEEGEQAGDEEWAHGSDSGRK